MIDKTNTNENLLNSDAREKQQYEIPFQVIQKIGKEGSTLNNPFSLSCDTVKNLYVFDYLENDFSQIIIFNDKNNVVKKLGPFPLGSGEGELDDPRGLDLSIDNRIFIPDNGNHRIVCLNSDGSIYQIFGEMGLKAGQFNFPNDVFVDSAGNIFVADTENNRIQKFNSSGKPILVIGNPEEPGDSTGELDGPTGVFVDGNGLIYVADTNNSRLQLFTQKGDFIREIGGQTHGKNILYYPLDVRVTIKGDIFVLDSDGSRILKFDKDGDLIYIIRLSGQNYSARDFYVDSDEHIFFPDSIEQQILVIHVGV